MTNSTPSCETAIWGIAHWVMNSAEGELLVMTFTAKDVTASQQETMRSELAQRLLDAHKAEPELEELLGYVGTHPKSRESAMRSALDYIKKAYAKCSSVYPESWLVRYQEFLSDHDRQVTSSAPPTELVLAGASREFEKEAVA